MRDVDCDDDNTTVCVSTSDGEAVLVMVIDVVADVDSVPDSVINIDAVATCVRENVRDADSNIVLDSDAVTINTEPVPLRIVVPDAEPVAKVTERVLAESDLDSDLLCSSDSEPLPCVELTVCVSDTEALTDSPND